MSKLDDELKAIFASTVMPDDLSIMEETRKQKIGDSSRGRTRDPVIVEKIKKALTGRKNPTAALHTPESIAKMKVTVEKKKADGWVKPPPSLETRQRLSESGKGRSMSTESRIKSSRSQSAYIYTTPLGIVESMLEVKLLYPDISPRALEYKIKKEWDGFKKELK